MGGKKASLSARAKAAEAAEPMLMLRVPPELRPAASDELRLAALQLLCKSLPLYSLPAAPSSSEAWPPLPVPKREVVTFALGKTVKYSPRFVFFRKFVLMLVCEDDLLKSYVDSNGQALKGSDCRKAWHEALIQVLRHTREESPPDLQEDIRLIIAALESGAEARAIVWRARFAALRDYALAIGLPIAMAWYMGYFTFEDVSSGLTALVDGGGGGEADPTYGGGAGVYGIQT